MIKEKKYNIYAKKEQIFLLEMENQLLVDCSISSEGEDYLFTFCMNGLEKVTQVDKSNKIDCLRLALNVGKFYALIKQYEFELSPENIVFDYSMEPRILMRDLVKAEDLTRQEVFLRQYKSFCGFLLQKKYSFEDYDEGGEDLLKKQQETKQLYECTDIEQVKKHLYQMYQKEMNDISENTVRVRKNPYRFHKWMERVSFIVLLGLLVYTGILTGIRMPKERKLSQANEAYILGDNEKTVSLLAGLKLEDIPYNTKYVYANACLNGVTWLEAKKKEVARQGIMPSSSESVYDFWICLQRGNYDKAVDLAKKLGNNDYMIAAYARQLQAVKEDTNISGSKKQEKEKNIEEELNQLQQSMQTENNQ